LDPRFKVKDGRKVIGSEVVGKGSLIYRSRAADNLRISERCWQNRRYFGLLTFSNTFLFGLAVPFTEMVFRGMAQRAPIAYVTPLAAILVCAHLSASLWHVFRFPFALILGITSSALY
jgi:hypothetical protein